MAGQSDRKAGVAEMRGGLTVLMMLLMLLPVGAQRIGFEEIDDARVSLWEADSVAAYQAVYHFGDSELEWDLVLLHAGGRWYAQTKSGSWADESERWVAEYENFSNVRVEGNRFSSNQSIGAFVYYDGPDGRIRGLKLYDEGDTGAYEIGYRSHDVADHYAGAYPQASLRLLGEGELRGMSKPDLRIMRNEIFARYGYLFRPGGEMDRHFRKQRWYDGQHEDVNNYLTDIERANIDLIRAAERE